MATALPPDASIRHLRYEHPGLYGVALAQVVASTVMGLGLLLGPDLFTATPSYEMLREIPSGQEWLGVAHLVPAALVLVAIFRDRLLWLRFGFAGLMAAFAWHGLMILVTWYATGPKAWVAPPVLLAHAYISYLATKEPVTNPASQRLDP